MALETRVVSPLFDLQVNGYAGIDFNADTLEMEQVSYACERLASDGLTGILATIITDEMDSMVRRIKRLVQACESVAAAKTIIRGIHIEGPFISDVTGYVGTHPKSEVCPPNKAAVERLVDAGQGLIRLLTLAPEKVEHLSLVRWLVDQGITVSAGHCDPSIDQLKAAIDHGLSMFTHLGNGCPLSLPRHDNVIQRALSLREHLWICFIADGVHIPFPVLENYLALVGEDRAIIVSDAISAAGLGPGEFTLGSIKVVVDEQLATWSPDRSHLMGSALTMKQAYGNLLDRLSISAESAKRLTYDNAKAAVGLS